MTDPIRDALEDLEAASELAERLLMDAEGYDKVTRLVLEADLLRIVQLVNAAISHLETA